jgi:hypothetical protein
LKTKNFTPFITAAICGSLLTTGCFGLGKRDDAIDAVSATLKKTAAPSITPDSNISRSSGDATYVKLKALFPAQLTGTLNYTDINTLAGQVFGAYATDYSPFSANGATGIQRTIGSPERPSTLQAQGALAQVTDNLCNITNIAANDNQVYSTQDILMDGETLPSDTVSQLAFAAARNAWLYPYTVDSEEVRALITFYNTALQKYPGNTTKAKQELCKVVVSAPQFWMGNSGSDDLVRRVAVEIGRRRPTFTEISAFHNRLMTIGQYVQKLQSEPGYFNAVASWHQQWLGLEPFSTGTGRANGSENGTGGYNSIGGADFYHLYNPVTQHEYIQFSGSSRDASISESCTDDNTLQDFDPRTTALIWEHKNPVLTAKGLPEAQQWEEVGRWTRAGDGTWGATGGQITMADGVTKKNITLKDITVAMPPLFAPDKNAARTATYRMADSATPFSPGLLDADYNGYRCYTTGGLVGTPLECFFDRQVYATTGVTPRIERRVRRITPTGEQNGYSLVNLWANNQPIRVCNGLSRIMATCTYRPAVQVIGVQFWVNTAGWDALSGGATATGTPTEQHARLQHVTSDQLWVGDMLAHPAILADMHCGIPNTVEIEKGGTANYNELLSYPLGFSSYAAALDKTLINSLAVGPDIMFTRGGGWGTGGDTSPISYTAPDDPTTNASIWMAYRRYQQDILLEPFRLLQDIIKNDKDYRLLLTADYTYGRKELELTYRSQGFYLPAYPPGYTPTDWSSGDFVGINRALYNNVSKITQASLLPIPLNWGRASFTAKRVIAGSDGIFDESAQPVYLADSNSFAQVRTQFYRATNRIPPKRLKGILSMPAFLGPVSQKGQKIRSVSSRYFRRLLCGDEQSVALTPEQRDMQTPYIPGSRNPAENPHLDPKQSCYGCHVNMDPLAAALSTNFSWRSIWDNRLTNAGRAYDDSLGEMIWFENYMGVRWSDYEAEGAFLGTKVKGLNGVADVLAQSRGFAHCVVQKAFENIYGHSATFSDTRLLNSITDKFTTTDNYSYNAMVRDLVSDPLYSKGD